MRLLDEIKNSQNGAPVKEMAKNFNVDERDVDTILEQLIPAVTNGIKKNLSRQDGLEELLDALRRSRHDRYLEHPHELNRRDTVTDGNDILGSHRAHACTCPY